MSVSMFLHHIVDHNELCLVGNNYCGYLVDMRVIQQIGRGFLDRYHCLPLYFQFVSQAIQRQLKYKCNNSICITLSNYNTSAVTSLNARNSLLLLDESFIMVFL